MNRWLFRVTLVSGLFGSFVVGCGDDEAQQVTQLGMAGVGNTKPINNEPSKAGKAAGGGGGSAGNPGPAGARG